MGVPKFFRWLSERYPAISQLIAENRIPEFDALYLDMNGIIHNCTHKDSDDTQFRLSEDEMFIRIFNYIEHLFGKIKPKQLFFMAVDGVAPRAKMNQQRARRFRTALDAEVAREKALREGQELPKEEPFDSNCITPGTEFMAKLSRQLRYFVNKKVSEDSDWQGCEIVLSGHDVPGEGEHKIMEYIRNARAQPNYEPNMRHCLYGLDADLIMLGLLSHDPHFCLLREEVTFGRQSKTKSKELEHQNFYLMHLCIVREYLELEFQDLKKEGAISFPFDMEKVIDDFILMGFFVGNDFLPNLPRLHINEGALSTMFRIYKRVLPKCDGYINEGGDVNVKRLGLLLEELSKEEFRFFEHENEGAKWLRAKRSLKNGDHEAPKPKGKVIITSPQKSLWKQKIRKFVTARSPQLLDLGTELKAEDRKFVQDLADSLNIHWATKEDDDGHRHLVLSFPEKPDTEEDEEDDESQLAVSRVVKKYDNAEIVDISPEEAQADMEAQYQQKFQEWKDKYYAEKFVEWTPENKDEELRKLCENYVQGLQWVLFYYYRGIASWPWFYQYHYAPLISDVQKGLGADFNFKLGQPFRPFEQLMGVLPDRSKKIVPPIYWDLMTNPDSPIIDFYPRDFELDMNGKKMEWEAVVKIPFIDEKRLLDAMAPKTAQLTEDEKARNDFGVPLKFTYSPGLDFVYPSSLVGIFPDIPHCHCVENIFDLPPTDGLDYRTGLMDGALLHVSALAGFPSLATLPYTAALGFHGVNVFQQDSRNESMVVTLSGTEMRTKIESAKAKLGKRCFVGYPFLTEAKVMRVSDELFDFVLAENGSGEVLVRDHAHKEIDEWQKMARRSEDYYSKRLGIIIGQVESMVHVHMLKGLVKTEEGATVKEYGEIPGILEEYAAQTVVDNVVNEDERFIERAALPIEEEFPVHSHAFFLGEFNYGRPLEVIGHADNKLEIWLSALKGKEQDFAKPLIFKYERENRYMPSFHVAKDLGLHPLVLSKITSSFQLLTVGDLKVNLGLNLKFESRKLKVLGYSRKSQSGWEFSQAAIKLIIDYMTTFPDFFAGLQRNPTAKDPKATDVWKDEATAVARVKEIGQWLKAAKVNQLDKVPLDAEQLDSDVVMALAAAADESMKAFQGAENKRMKAVPRSALLKPSDAEQRLGNQRFGLGDRVVYVQDSGKVPIAIRGTVVGISRAGQNKVLDVLFDTTFMSGTTLDGRCPPFRGQTISDSSVLNLTDRQVVVGSKAGLERRPVRAVGSVTTMANGGAYGAGTKQYRDAPTPAPLRGSFRGAINGANVHLGRGAHGSPGHRGSLNLQPSSMVYRPAPNGTAPHAHGVPNGTHQQTNGFTPRGRGGRGGRGRGGYPAAQGAAPNGHPTPASQGPPPTESYNNMPPPPNLDARGRGRGRGRGGSRGRGVPQRGGRGGGAPAAQQQQQQAAQG
ncbi:5'-3' exoribonuclease 1 [Pleurostoma richardsiae]|uniref:5'-3' exoribonuclease 1 n=1 Tax=Pleurostoma richardsiae TaxID=41990 RepID=A0AA38RQ37_9PEZI|nr:5'-3' exoribonuclease 1 [Pleurostoma richardsiae]